MPGVFSFCPSATILEGQSTGVFSPRQKKYSEGHCDLMELRSKGVIPHIMLNGRPHCFEWQRFSATDHVLPSTRSPLPSCCRGVLSQGRALDPGSGLEGSVRMSTRAHLSESQNERGWQTTQIFEMFKVWKKKVSFLCLRHRIGWNLRKATPWILRWDRWPQCLLPSSGARLCLTDGCAASRGSALFILILRFVRTLVVDRQATRRRELCMVAFCILWKSRLSPVTSSPKRFTALPVLEVSFQGGTRGVFKVSFAKRAYSCWQRSPQHTTGHLHHCDYGNGKCSRSTTRPDTQSACSIYSFLSCVDSFQTISRLVLWHDFFSWWAKNLNLNAPFITAVFGSPYK